MEGPHYGRTGLLASRLGGLPVTRARLPVSSDASAAYPVRWYPSLLTVPQQLLDALRREDDGVSDHGALHVATDATLLNYLCVATVAESLVQWWRRWAAARRTTPSGGGPSRAQCAGLYSEVLRWCRERDATGGPVLRTSAVAGGAPSPPSFTFYVPTYKLLVMKDGRKVGEHARLTWRSLWLLGKEAVVNDVPLEHPSCSGQHAALEMRFVAVDEAALGDCVTGLVQSMARAAPVLPSPSLDAGAPLFAQSTEALHAVCAAVWAMLNEALSSAGGDASAVWTVELQLIDLASTNRTKLNGEAVAPMEATTVIDSDVLEFGCSTRKYVVMRDT
ncbi:hypothetical protein NESM_000715500 [Novymonas esmeraldas]|uniref:FHA domain-containing protein n=1 Tax=Novymonas esmeraldas TaxID=1808958 RepID=A0AAW0EVN6_9TRYP